MRIVIEEGATFIGKSEVTPNKAIKHDRAAAPAPDAARKNQPATAAA
jgi:hypothetical protein